MKVKLVTEVMADHGAFANFISSKFLQKLMKESDSFRSQDLKPTQTYWNLAGDTCLKCHQFVKLDVHLQIRHGTSLLLRNITWKGTVEELQIPIILRWVLESFVCDNRKCWWQQEIKSEAIYRHRQEIGRRRRGNSRSMLNVSISQKVSDRLLWLERRGCVHRFEWRLVGSIEKKLQERIKETEKMVCASTKQKSYKR